MGLGFLRSIGTALQRSHRLEDRPIVGSSRHNVSEGMKG